MLSKHCHFGELGAEFFDQFDPERITRYHVKRLESLGFNVELEKAAFNLGMILGGGGI